MMGPSHRLLGMLAGVTVAHVAGQDLAMTLVSGVVASAASHGPTSPDLDQSHLWVGIRKVMPRVVAHEMSHRMLTHRWWPPLAVAIIATPALGSATVMLLAGWVSHLVGDFVFGKVPAWPWGDARVGLGLDTGGFIETGRVQWAGHSRKVIPFAPIRVVFVVGIIAVLLATLGK